MSYTRLTKSERVYLEKRISLGISVPDIVKEPIILLKKLEKKLSINLRV